MWDVAELIIKDTMAKKFTSLRKNIKAQIDLPVWVMRKDAMLHEEKGFFCGSWSSHRTFIMDRAVSYYVFFSDIIQHNYLMKPEAG